MRRAGSTALAGPLAASTRPSPVTASTGSGMASISAARSAVAVDGCLASNMSRFASTLFHPMPDPESRPRAVTT